MIKSIQNKSVGKLQFLFPNNLSEMNIIESFEVPSLTNDQLWGSHNSDKSTDFPGVLKDFWDGENRISVANKRKPHAFYDLMLMETNLINRPSICDLSYTTARKIMFKTYQFVDFISKIKNIIKFNLDNGHLHIVYNFNHLPDRTSAMSVNKFHIHLNYWPKSHLDKAKVSNIKKNEKLINLLDPTMFLASEIMNHMISFEKFKFVEKKPYSIDNYIQNNSPIGLELKLIGGWETLKSNKFISLLFFIHKKLMSLDLMFNYVFTGKSSYPGEWERHQLVCPAQFERNIELLRLPKELENKITLLHKSLKNLDYEQLKRLKSKPYFFNKHVIIKALNYSVSIYSPYRNSLRNPIIKSDDVRLLIQVKKFSSSGGAGQTFFPGLASLVNIERGKTFFNSKDIKQRHEFQQDFIKFLEKYE